MRIAEILRQVSCQDIDPRPEVSTNPGGLPQGKTRAISERIVIEPGCYAERLFAEAHRVREAATVENEVMALLHGYFRHHHLISSDFCGGRGLFKAFTEPTRGRRPRNGPLRWLD